MGSTDRQWRKGVRVRHRDKRTGRVNRDAELGASVHVAFDGGGSAWIAGRLLVEIDDKGREVPRP